uniref:Uncharacterized protein n=1 Tax=Arundo donax TaxID=35708 RepID=A0A0A9A808_ARUDO
MGLVGVPYMTLLSRRAFISFSQTWSRSMLDVDSMM